jgi:hypothetical protein
MTHPHRLGAAAGVFVALVSGAAEPRAAQQELDRIVTRVAGRPITRSDVQLARALQLVDDAASDAAAQRALENRLLALNEVARLIPSEQVGDGAVAERRAAWEQRVGGADQARRLLSSYDLSEAELVQWFRDDLRIAALLSRQFGMLGGADRDRETAEWLARLRQRADLR